MIDGERTGADARAERLERLGLDVVETEFMGVSLHALLDRLEKEHGSLRQLSRDTGIDVGYLSKIRSGFVRWPEDDVLTLLGVRRIVTYEKIEKR